MRHLERFLDDYDRFFVAPHSLRPCRPGFEIKPFDDANFTSIATYSRLLLSPSFYRAFAHYKFILIHQLDSLVFADALSDWCQAGYDYLGAPWLADPSMPGRGFSRTGNGGLSLRRIDACLRVLEPGSDHRPLLWWRSPWTAPLPDLARYRVVKRARVLREARRGADWYAGHYTLNEDHFWSDRAALFSPDFRVAPVEAALRFSFERAPRYCWRRNGGKLPFGCHAWNRWDRDFWEPYLIS